MVEKINTPGGRALLLAALFLSGVVMIAWRLPKGEDVLVGSFAALLAILRPQD